MKKVLYTLNIGYSEEITKLTYPFLRKYAEKIGAEFEIISERKFPDWPMDYEKLQIYELGKNNDWNIYIDSDALIHPDFFDVTNHVHKDTVLHNAADFANIRWRYDKYFRRDGRNIGSCNWFAIASDWCIDLWHPLEDLTLEEATRNIYPTNREVKSNGRVGLEPGHLISDYTLSRNIARYGLKFNTIMGLLQKYDPNGGYLSHDYISPLDIKVKNLKTILKQWDLATREQLDRWDQEEFVESIR